MLEIETTRIKLVLTDWKVSRCIFIFFRRNCSRGKTVERYYQTQTSWTKSKDLDNTQESWATMCDLFSFCGCLKHLFHLTKADILRSKIKNSKSYILTLKKSVTFCKWLKQFNFRQWIYLIFHHFDLMERQMSSVSSDFLILQSLALSPLSH